MLLILVGMYMMLTSEISPMYKGTAAQDIPRQVPYMNLPMDRVVVSSPKVRTRVALVTRVRLRPINPLRPDNKLLVIWKYRLNLKHY